MFDVLTCHQDVDVLLLPVGSLVDCELSNFSPENDASIISLTLSFFLSNISVSESLLDSLSLLDRSCKTVKFSVAHLPV